MHLRRIHVDQEAAAAGGGFARAVPALAGLESMDLDRPVTFFVGENGSGKSTLIEALAWATRSVAVGASNVDADETLAAVRPFAKALRLEWRHRTRRGFFLRAEDFFGFVRRTRTELAGLDERAAQLRQENPEMPEGELARISAPYAGSAAALRGRYGDDPDARSHGEQFLAFFQERLVPDALYLLDEPEVPLSPQRQLTLLSVLKEHAEQHSCQFVIATHSPILLALPQAEIFSFDDPPIRSVAWDDLEHVKLTRDFLNRPQSFLRHL